jgi:hypothetical protein
VAGFIVEVWPDVNRSAAFRLKQFLFGPAIAKAELWGQISFGEVDTRSDDGICSFGSAYWI